MSRRHLLRFSTRQSLRIACVSSAVWAASACNSGIDTTRQAAREATLGDDLYGLMCDRVGAASLSEDLSGASFHSICHYDDNGKYGDKVDTSVLPPVSGTTGTTARERGIAKAETMGRRRSDLIRAFNAMFPDVEIPDVTNSDSGAKIRLHDALFSLAQTLTPLYETNPYDAKGEPLLPHSTRSLGRLFDALAQSDAARGALANIWGRRGYRPFNVALGAIRPALAYPSLRDLTKAELKVLGPQGFAVPELQQLLTVSKQELKTSKPVVTPLPAYLVDPATAQPNRPRSTVEVTAAMLLDQNDAYAENVGDAQRFISLRDKRGFAIPAGASPGMIGSIPAPFTDMDKDGFADVDAFGRFVDASNAPLSIDPPFAVIGVQPLGALDPFGRPMKGVYSYLDTSRALTGSLSRNLVPLVDSTKYAAAGDPNAWQSEHETLMYALAGAYSLYGDREDAQYDYSKDAIVDAPCDSCIKYSRFKSEDSPIPDLIHALGQVLADKDSDAILLSMMDLLQNHEDVVARLLGAALNVKAIADQHDALAAAGSEPLATMPYTTTIWDEMAQIMARITAHPGLTAELLAGLADDSLVMPAGNSSGMGDTLSRFMSFRDKLTYNASDINGPASNLTTSDTSDMKTPVDRTMPQSGDNRSCFQKSLQTIHDARNVKACNKSDAYVYISLIDTTWPLVGSGYDQCDLFAFDNLAGFYLDSLLPDGHPKRSELAIKSSTLTALLNFASGIGLSEDQLLEQSSGITGLGKYPTPQALNRLVFFGADSENYPGLPDHDGKNAGSATNKFVSNSIEPVSSAACPQNGSGVNTCPDATGLLRTRDYASIFLWERYGFYSYLQPIVKKFAALGCASDLSNCNAGDYTGEQIFIDMIDALHHNWSGKDHGAECNTSGNPVTNPNYCSEAGVSTYEPILADAFKTDLIPALNAFAKVAVEASEITVARGPNAGQTMTGAQVLETLTKILFDQGYAASVGMVDRAGNSTAKWVDGTVQPQLTAFNLFTDALHKIDTRFDAVADKDLRKGQWKRARSQLVDQFLAVDGSGTAAKFKNPGTPKMLLAVLKVMREQVNANCKNREGGAEVCAWAKKDLGDKLATTLSGPLFAGMMDVQEQIRTDDTARRALESFLQHILQSSSSGDALQASLASVSDLLQVLADDGQLSPIFNAIANAANPADDAAGAGCADTTVKVLSALVSDQYDKYHVVDAILPALVTPMDGGAGASPVEVIIDTIADVNRIDAAAESPLDINDYKAIMQSVNGFLTSDTRGLEQFYFIVQNRLKE